MKSQIIKNVDNNSKIKIATRDNFKSLVQESPNDIQLLCKANIRLCPECLEIEKNLEKLAEEFLPKLSNKNIQIYRSLTL